MCMLEEAAAMIESCNRHLMPLRDPLLLRREDRRVMILEAETLDRLLVEANDNHPPGTRQRRLRVKIPLQGKEHPVTVQLLLLASRKSHLLS
jgi:hypothetical protein